MGEKKLYVHGKNNFSEVSKIYLNTDRKMILSNVKIIIQDAYSSIMNNAAKKF